MTPHHPLRCMFEDKKAPFKEPDLKLRSLRSLAHINPTARSNHYAQYNRTNIVFTHGKTGARFHAGGNKQTLENSLHVSHPD